MIAREHETAYKRIIARVLELTVGIINPNDDLVEAILVLYKSMGGNWVEFYDGVPAQVSLLKKCSRAMHKAFSKIKKVKSEKYNDD